MIRQPWLAHIAFIALAVALFVAAERLYFLSRAEHTSGTVIEVTSSNGRCGGGRRGPSHSCTKYQAHVRFITDNQRLSDFEVSAGSCRGHNTGQHCASFKLGSNVPVVYDPRKPERAYIDSLMGVWSTAVLCLMFSAITLFASFFEPRRRSYGRVY